MLPSVTLMFIQCRKVRSLAKKALASVRRRVEAMPGNGKKKGRRAGGRDAGRARERRLAALCAPSQRVLRWVARTSCG